MLKFIIFITIFLLLSSTSLLVVFFVKNNFDLDKALKELKDIFLPNCCISKKAKEKISSSELSKIEENMEELEDCKEPIKGLPFDICIGDNLTEEDIVLRSKLMDILSKQKRTIIANGKERIQLPLEATLFLTKKLQPLVNENGEIYIIAERKTQEIELSPKEKLRQLVYKLADTGDIVYEEKDKLYQDLLTLLKLSKEETLKNEENSETLEKNKSLEDTNEEILDKEDTNIEKEVKSDNINTEELDNDIMLSSEEDLNALIKSEFENDKEDTENIENEEELDIFGDNELDLNELIKQEDFDLDDLETTEEEKSSLEEDIEENNITEENKEQDSEVQDKGEPQQSIKDLVEIPEQEEKNEKLDIEEFYKNKLSYISSQEPIEIKEDNLQEALEKLFENTRNRKAFFSNLAKTKPLIFSKNKEVVYVPQENIFLALSKLINGLEYKKIVDFFEKLDLKHKKEIGKILSEIFIEYLVDENQKGFKPQSFEENGAIYNAFCLKFQAKAFKDALGNDKFDFFSSFAYNNAISLSNERADFKNKLIPNVLETEI